VTDLLDPFETIRGAEQLARNMGDPHQTNRYDTPGGLRREERLAGLLAVGSDMLTTAMLMTFAIEDILDGQSVIWIGSDSSARMLLHYIPGDRVNDVIFFSPGSKEDRACPIAWNLLNDTPPDARYLVAEAVTAAFGSIYQQFWGPQSDFILRTAVLANLDAGNATLLGCLAMFSNSRYRAIIRRHIKDPVVRDWWDEFERWPNKKKQDATAPLQNKLGALLTSWPLRNILCQRRNKLAVNEVFKGKILIVELSNAHIGSQEKAALLGSLLIHDLMRAGQERQASGSPDCFVYINNAAAFAPAVIDAFVVGADSPFSIALATTHLDRLAPSLAQTLLGACGTILASRSSYTDAQTFYKYFGEIRMKEREFAAMDWNELAVKPWTGRPYWSKFEVFPHAQFAQFWKADSIIARSLDRYGTPRSKVERAIRAWYRQSLPEDKRSPSPRKRH
jgi:hypothetical protein